MNEEALIGENTKFSLLSADVPEEKSKTLRNFLAESFLVPVRGANRLRAVEARAWPVGRNGS